MLSQIARRFSSNTSLAKISPNSLQEIKSKMEHNLNAYPTRANPNGLKLIDGAIQRASV
jgi:hypothetical protein